MLRLPRAALIAVAAALVLAACTKAPPPNGAPTTASDTASATPSATSTTDPASNTPSAMPTTSSPSAVATTSRPTSRPPAGPAACSASQLTVAVQRGSGAAGHQFASLVFTNSSATTCSLTGFPGAELILNGAPLGVPAQRSNKQISEIDLKPKASANALLTNDSTCNADNSDSVQVIPPNTTEKVILPLRFRGCDMTIDPVAAS